MPRKSIPEGKRVRVIVDPRNVHADVYVDEGRAKAMYMVGDLAWDTTNMSYTLPSKPERAAKSLRILNR